MNSKAGMFNILNGKAVNRIPVAPHWWGLFKFQLAGIASGYHDEDRCWNMYGKTLAAVDSNFYETFKPDWLHLGIGYDNSPDKEYKKVKLLELAEHVGRLESKAVIDEYVASNI